ncbi:TRAP-type C4-dicarboxylate transport system, small permease component [Kushneria avicenniae]|uniref:TRAP transporter small permease protein n=1 Tax=Kushneria avicenniae TaxID=402385 RepID=A0A1I1NCS9_9GAMM|nr:TRAP transporter small permease [Kushneria avicenniae]SFC91550.1 TRAP-type C4-dicarboxylate transport system, small permease component [Kushneria avicenniae]
MFRGVWRSIEWLIVALMTAMMVLVFVNVVLRYGFSSGLRSGIELSRLGFVWIVMLGASLCLKDGEHLAVSEVFDRLPGPVRSIIARLLWVVILGGSVMLMMGCWKQTLANWHNISPLTGLPSGLFYLAGVVAGALMSMTSLMGLLRPGPGRAPGEPAGEGPSQAVDEATPSSNGEHRS